ncbi:MAG: hypothetical protein ACRBF0_23685 [Calditrichia bacterium]
MDLEKYVSTLRQLSAENIAYVTIGTWALKCLFPDKMQGYPIKDCDLIIRNNMTEIRKAILLLRKNRWKVTVWESDVDEQVEAEFLKDKYYLRAKRAQLTLDITYECPFIRWQELSAKKSIIKGCNIASLQHILHLKQIKGSENDLLILKRFESI